VPSALTQRDCWQRAGSRRRSQIVAAHNHWRDLSASLARQSKADTVEEAASADMVLVAVRWIDLEKALGGLPAWNDQIVIDGTNPVAFLP
jgi:predicted dinucleotide-binding enzyme